jgi:hypothetical protein
LQNTLFEKLIIIPKRKVNNESNEALSSWTLICNKTELKYPWSVLKGFYSDKNAITLPVLVL